MKSGILRTLSLVLCALLLGGCSTTSQDTSDTSTSGETNTGETTNTAADTSNTGSDETTVTDSSGQSKDGMVTAGEYKPTVEEMKDAASKLEHLTVSENLSIEFPQELDRFYSYYESYPEIPYTEDRDKFNKIFEFAFPWHTLNEDFLTYDGDYSGQLDENNQYPPMRKVKDYEDALIAGTEDFNELIYQDGSDAGTVPIEDTVSMVMLNPPFGSLVYLNRGEINHKMGDAASEYLMPHAKPEYFEFVGTYSPGDMKSFTLFDGETRICDAAENLSAELNELWKSTFCEVPSDQVMRLGDVDVYRLLCGEDLYVYSFSLYNEYKGFSGRYKDNGYSTPHGDSSDTMGLDITADVSGPIGVMARSDRFDFLFMTGFNYTVLEEREHARFYSASSALEAVRGELTQGADFELERVEFWDLRCTPDDRPEGSQYYNIPGWVFMLHNLQDDFYYECFISAIDLDDFGYRKRVKD